MLRVAALTVVLILLSYPNLAQDRQTVEEHYSAVVMGTGEPMEGRSLQFDFRIERYASDEQVNSFARRLKDRGQDALGSALQRDDVGRISSVDSVGNQIALARKRRVGSDTMVVVVTARNMPFLELYRSGRSTRLPLRILASQAQQRRAKETAKSWPRPSRFQQESRTLRN